MRTPPTAEEVAAFLAWDTDQDTLNGITPHLASVTAFTRAYTRGRGFTDSEVADEVAAVIVQATARSVTNPEQATRVEVGTYNAMPARFDGFNLVEQSALNGHRRRMA